MRRGADIFLPLYASQPYGFRLVRQLLKLAISQRRSMNYRSVLNITRTLATTTTLALYDMSSW